MAGCVGVTRGGATGCGDVGAGVGVGVGVGCPRRSPGATGGKPLSEGPCTPGARPSSVGGGRRKSIGRGDVVVSCAATGAPAASIAAASANAAACCRPKLRTVILSAIPHYPYVARAAELALNLAAGDSRAPARMTSAALRTRAFP